MSGDLTPRSIPRSAWTFPVVLVVLCLALAGCGNEGASESSPPRPTGNGTIQGQVVGKDGPVAGALVQLSSLADEACAAANDAGLDLIVGQSDADIELLQAGREELERIPTDENGQYRFESVPAGIYAIWIHWEQDQAPGVPLSDIPEPGYYFTTLWVDMVGSSRVDVSMHEETDGVYEVDVHVPSFDFSGEGELAVDFDW